MHNFLIWLDLGRLQSIKGYHSEFYGSFSAYHMTVPGSEQVAHTLGAKYSEQSLRNKL